MSILPPPFCYLIYIDLATPVEIPVSQCKQPNKSRLLGTLDRACVDKLKERMIEDPSAPGTPPLALLCYNKKRDMVKT